MKVEKHHKRTLYCVVDTETDDGYLGDAIAAQWCFFDSNFNDYTTLEPIRTPLMGGKNYTLYNRFEEFSKSPNPPDTYDHPQIALKGNPIKALFESIYKTARKSQARKVIVFIHNSHYDNMRIIKQGEAEGVAVKEQLVNGAVIFGSYKYRGMRIEFRDTVKMLQGSLGKLAESFCPYLPKLDKDHFYGFALNLDKDLKPLDDETAENIEYAKRDVTTLKHVLYHYAKTIGCSLKELKLTAPSQAFDAVKKSYYTQAALNSQWKVPYRKGKDGKKNFFFPALSKTDNGILEKFYRGGRVIIKEGLSPVELFCAASFDETSAYPFCMKDFKYPLPGKTYVKMMKVPKTAATGDSGRFLIEITVTDYQADLPVLPYKKNWEDKDQIAVYPRSEKPFKTFITDNEYFFYLTQKKAGTHTVDCVYYWSDEKCDYWLKDFVDVYYAMKSEGDRLNKEALGSGDALRATAKLMLNSAYGKFGQKYVNEDTAIYFNDFELDDGDVFDPDRLINDHRNFHIAAMVTGAARVRLYEAIDYYGAENNIYSDTDSVKILASAYMEKGAFVIPGLSPDELGGWKYEGRYDGLVIKAPKQYAGVHHEVKEQKDGTIKLKTHTTVKAKGLPMKDARFINNHKFNFDKPKKTREAEEKRMVETVYDLFKKGEQVNISYSEKPVQAKTFKEEGVYAKERIGTSTDPKKVTGYHWDGERYQIHVVGTTI